MKSSRKESPFIVSMFVLAVFCAACNPHKQDPIDSDSPPIEESVLGQKPPGLIPELFMPDFVSTENLEMGGVFSPDMKEFYFVRQLEGDSPKGYLIRYKEGAWEEPIEQPGMGAGSISPDGHTMFSGNTYRERTPQGWSEEKDLGPPFDTFPIMRLTVSAAGTYVFDEREEIGTLRYARLIDGQREAPKAFSKEINSGKWTAHPFIAPDESYLIWDSEREGGYGETDLYISFRQEDGSWGPAINMGEDINTEFEDGGGYVTPDGNYFFFETIHLGERFNESTANIFWVDAQVIENLRNP